MTEGMQLVRFFAPSGGLNEDVDPALHEYPDNQSPSLENIRASLHTWKPRLGMASVNFGTLPGSGTIWFLGVHYTSSGVRVWLMLRGGNQFASNGVLYDFVEGVDSTFQSVATSQYSDYWVSTQVSTYTYIATRNASGSLYKYTSTGASGGGSIIAVTQGTAPTTAPNALPYFAGVLEPFTSSYTATDAAKFSIAADTDENNLEEPYNDDTQKFTLKSTALNQRLYKTGLTTAVPTMQLVFWAKQSDDKMRVAFQYGVTNPGQFQKQVDPRKADRWFPVFVRIGTLAPLKYLRWKCLNAPTSDQYLRVSPVMMSGRLDGKYSHVYTYQNTTAATETQPSPVTGSTTSTDTGTPVDLSETGQSGNVDTQGAMKKCAMISVTPSGSSGSQYKIRVWRNGGLVPEFITDSRGVPVWVLVGTVNDYETYLTSSPAAGATSFTVNSVTYITAGDWLQLDPGNSVEEFIYVDSIAGSTITCTTTPLVNAHSSGATHKVRPALLDNTPESMLATATRIDRERPDPPNAVKTIAKDGNNRLWILYGNTTVGVSNLPTYLRQQDQEVFPVTVDPITRRNPTQGWAFDLASKDPGDTTVQMVMFHGVPTIFTRRRCYQVLALSQETWATGAVAERFKIGCVADRSVVEVSGRLFWVAPGPRVMMWDGQSEPVDISSGKIGTRLRNTDKTYWGKWHAQGHVKEQGAYYCLWYAHSSSTVDRCLQFNVNTGAWEPQAYYDSGAARIPMDASVALTGVGERDQYYAASSSKAKIYELDQQGTYTDDGQGVRITAVTQSARFPAVSRVHWLYFRLAAVTDSLTMAVGTGGSDYLDVTTTYSSISVSGSGEKEVRKRGGILQKGRWGKVTITGTLSNQATVRDLELRVLPIRDGRLD